MSYYSDADVRKLKSGKWQAYMYWRDGDNKRHQVTKTMNSKLKRDAKTEAREWREELESQAAIMPVANCKQLTVREAVDNYLEYQLNTGQIEKSSYFTQKKVTENRIYRYIGDYGFRDLDRIAINKWLTDLAADGLKQGTIKIYHNIVAKVYRYHYECGDINRNPFDFVKTPKPSPARKTYLDTEQSDDLIIYLTKQSKIGDWFYTSVLLAYYGGLRRGEICGLRWSDVNFETEMITISTSIGVGPDGTYTKSPKTGASIRTFPLIPQLLDALQCRYQFVQEKEGEVKNNWFVTGEKTRYRNPSTFYNKFNKFIKQNELKEHFGRYITPHGLRHNLGSVGVRSNMDIESLSAMMGHSRASMTLDVYAMANEDAMIIASAKLGNQFSNETELYE